MTIEGPIQFRSVANYWTSVNRLKSATVLPSMVDCRTGRFTDGLQLQSDSKLLEMVIRVLPHKGANFLLREGAEEVVHESVGAVMGVCF